MEHKVKHVGSASCRPRACERILLPRDSSALSAQELLAPEIYAPLGCSVNRWSFGPEGPTLVHSIPQAHQDVVIALSHSPDGRYLATGSSGHTHRGGEMRVWDLEAEEPVSVFTHSSAVYTAILDLSWGQDSSWLAGCCASEFLEPAHPGAEEAFKVFHLSGETVAPGSQELNSSEAGNFRREKYTLAFEEARLASMAGRYTHCVTLSETTVALLRKAPRATSEAATSKKMESDLPDEVVLAEVKDEIQVTRQKLFPEQKLTCINFSKEDELLVLADRTRAITVLNTLLEPLLSFQASGSGTMRTLELMRIKGRKSDWQGSGCQSADGQGCEDSLEYCGVVCGGDDCKLRIWSCEIGGSGGSMVAEWTAPPGVVVALQNLDPDLTLSSADSGSIPRLCVGIDAGIHVLQPGQTTSLISESEPEKAAAPHAVHHGVQSLLRHEIACCGGALRTDNGGKTLGATGDLTGNIMVWDPEHGTGVKADRHFRIKDSVRCLLWSTECRQLLVGTLGGSIHYCRLRTEPVDQQDTDFPEQTQELQDLGSTIPCLAWVEESQGRSILAAATILGEVVMLEVSEDNSAYMLQSKVLLKVVAHSPAGALNMEVWSVAMSPCRSFMITGSEDQSSRVWQLKLPSACAETTSLDLIQALTGHTMAVTCVAWRGNMLATSSDDQTIRLYSWDETPKVVSQCLRILKVHDSHLMITYITILRHSQGDLATVLAGTMRGTLYNWKISEGDLETDATIESVPPVTTAAAATVTRLHCGSVEGLCDIPIPESKGNGCERSSMILSVSSDCSAAFFSV